MCKGTREGHAHDRHNLLHVFFDYPHNNLFYARVTSKEYAVSFPTSIKLPLSCTIQINYKVCKLVLIILGTAIG